MYRKQRSLYMFKIKLWFVNKMISLCNHALKYQDGADCQGEVNEVINTKNYFMREKQKLTK